MPHAHTDDRLYAALLSKDSRFDGRFFVGVSSTGIYCRPICRAKTPKAENCTFYDTAAEAEQAGYRPCLLCRPELAPGRSVTDARTNLARRAARVLEEECTEGQDLEHLAGKLGCTSRHLRRVFSSEYHITPIQYLQTCKLLLAKNLLTDSDLSVTEVASAAGFGSLRRFNDLFKKRYKLSPTHLRKEAQSHTTKHEPITLQLGYRPPYRWEEMLEFLAMRAIPGIELITENQYYRTVRHVSLDGNEVYGWIAIAHNPKRNTLRVSTSESLLKVLPHVLARVRHLFDLTCEPSTIYEALQSMNERQEGLCALGTRVPGCYDAFEMSVRAILGQQITVKAASTLAGRMVNALGKPVVTEIEGLTHVFPTPQELLALNVPFESILGPLGIISARAKTIEGLARELVSGNITLDASADPEQEMEKLKSIKGIGNWTAQYIAMRTLEWPDSFLETDIGVKHALAPLTPKEALALAEEWRPWRSYATVNLWNSLARK